MTLSFGKARFATASALLCISTFGTIAVASDQAPQSQSARSVAGVSADSQRVGGLTATAQSAEAKINASARQKRALLHALTSTEIKAVLMRNGFTANQLIGVKASQTATTQSRVKAISDAARVKITIKCCPLEIIISW